MKVKIKTTYLILGTALTLSSCTQEELPYDGPTIGYGRKITFRSTLPEVTSRAKETSGTDLTYFRITAFEPEEKDSIKNNILCEYIKNDTLFKDAEKGRFLSEDCVWPEMGKEEHVLHFFAYYPHLPAGAKIVNNTTIEGGKTTFDYKIENYTISPDIADQIDFVTAYASGSMEEKEFEGINLDFKHKLSRIEVKAKSSNMSCIIEIAGVRIGGIHTQATYKFKADEEAGEWSMDQEKGNVEYIYRQGDKIVTLNETNTAVSIMGASEDNNYAMLLPDSDPNGWNFTNDHANSNKRMFLSVLLRIIDKTPTTGSGKQQYPYNDNSQGLNALSIPREYFAIVKSTETVTTRLFRKNNSYFTDKECTKAYTLRSGEEVREFGWAALPISAEWESGKSYTYTLDYTSGVGLHDPSVPDPEDTSLGLKAGDPVISDRVGVSVSVNAWQGGTNTTHPYDVPGS